MRSLGLIFVIASIAFAATDPALARLEQQIDFVSGHATDAIVGVGATHPEAGGPVAVTARMRALGLNAIRVDRSTALLISAWQGAGTLPPESQWNRDIWDRLYNAVPQRDHMLARRAEMKDPRDTASPDDMN